MKDISSVESLVIPEGVTVVLKARSVTVTGPRGTLTKNVRHIQMDMQIVSGRNGRVGTRLG
jgi:large subunit ribosomal protein L9e